MVKSISSALLISCTMLSIENGIAQSFHFKSGFEPNTHLIQYQLNGNPNLNYADIYGFDTTSAYHWVSDLDDNSSVGNFRIYYEEGDTLKANARLVPDPLNPTNTVLRFKLDSANVTSGGNPKGRIQAALNNNTNLSAFRFRVKLFIHPDIETLQLYNDSITWLTLMEFWNNEANASYPFRITLNIQKPDTAVGSDLFFGAHGQTRVTTGVWDDLWKEINTSYILPTGEWITIETLFFEGDSTAGRYKVMLTDSASTTTLFDVHNYTLHPSDPSPDGVTSFNPMKLYTSGALINGMSQANAELAVFWDDLEIWLDTNVLSIRSDHPQDFEKTVLFPNPFYDDFTISSDHIVEKIKVFNSTGEAIRIIDKKQSMTVSDLQPGFYFVAVQFKNGISHVLRAVKL